MKNAIVLAAGYGTRLQRILGELPKPLVEVAGKPLISHVVSELDEIGIEQIYVVTNNKHFQRYEGWRNSSGRDDIQLINDGTNSNESRLGALADIDIALRRICPRSLEETLIVAADNLFRGLPEMNAVYDEMRRPLVGVYDVRRVEQARSLGVVELDLAGRIVGFEEKPREPKSTLCSTAIYFYTPDVLEKLGSYLRAGLPSDRLGDFLAWLLRQNKAVYGHQMQEWSDIGTPETLTAARVHFA